MKLIEHGERHKAGSVSVMVVDDEPEVRRVLGNFLAECDYLVKVADSGSQAVELLKALKFDIMLCDLIMPHMSGMEVLAKVKEFSVDTPVILMSAHVDMPKANAALDSGVADILVKPLSMLQVVIAIERTLRLREAEERRAVELRNRTLLGSIRALSAALDVRAHDTAEHSARITSAALAIADSIGLPAVDKSTLELAACMHDIGKIGLRDDILMKPDKLSDAEWEEIKTHPDVGGRILSSIEELSDVIEIIRHHHERIDGTGYPDGLSGDQIPLLSRILAIADSFDAMTSDRPYRKALSMKQAIAELQANAGKQFDADLVWAFIRSTTADVRLAA